MVARVGYSVPMLRVKDVERSVGFYESLGFKCTSMMRGEGGVATWANLSCFRGKPEELTTENESAAVMVSLGWEGSGDPGQGASLYVFSKDIEGLRADLMGQGVEVTEIVPRPWMPKGEMELRDPDGWKVLVGGV
jgi:catechol 2,3-dioxygenase-like lactoylglutathione lyase family enzyme